VPSTDNKQLMQHAFGHLAQGDGRPFTDLMAEDFQWTITGKTAWSRTYQGKQAVIEHLLRPLFASSPTATATPPSALSPRANGWSSSAAAT